MANCEKCSTTFEPSTDRTEVSSLRILCPKCEAERRAEKAARAKAAAAAQVTPRPAQAQAAARPAAAPQAPTPAPASPRASPHANPHENTVGTRLTTFFWAGLRVGVPCPGRRSTSLV